jgi:hypothetical protein
MVSKCDPRRTRFGVPSQALSMGLILPGTFVEKFALAPCARLAILRRTQSIAPTTDRSFALDQRARARESGTSCGETRNR